MCKRGVAVQSKGGAIFKGHMRGRALTPNYPHPMPLSLHGRGGFAHGKSQATPLDPR